MKIKTLFVIAASAALFSCTQTKKADFLYLSANQLKPLGIELNQNGIFYNNSNPNWEIDQEKYCGLAFYSSNDIHLSTFHYTKTDTLKAKTATDSLLLQLAVSNNDFYPLLIGNSKGQNNMDKETLPRDLKLLPVAICMSETQLPNRNDTLIVWFKPTDALKKSLPENIKMDDYLMSPIQ
jgi:hypothetical protein